MADFSNLLKLQEQLNEEAVTRKKVNPEYARWFLKNAVNKANLYSGRSGLNIDEFLKNATLKKGADTSEVQLVLNFLGKLYEEIRHFPDNERLNSTTLEQYFKVLTNRSWQAITFINQQPAKERIYRKSHRPVNELSLPPEEIRGHLRNAIEEYTREVKKANKEEPFKANFELFRQIIRIKPFEHFNDLLALLIFYSGMLKSGHIPAPFPYEEEEPLAQWMERNAMDQQTTLDHLKGQYHKSLDGALEFLHSREAGPDKTRDRLEQIRQYFERNKENVPDEGPYFEKVRRAYQTSIYPLVDDLFKALENVHSFFETFELNSSGMAVGTNADRGRVIKELKAFMKDPESRYFNINFHWRNLINGGPEAFGYFLSLQIEKDKHGYYLNRHDENLVSFNLGWDEDLSREEREKMVNDMVNQVLRYIEKHQKRG